MRFDLRWKILLLSVGAPVVLGPAALWYVDRSVSAHVRSTIDESLFNAAYVCENGLAARSRSLQASAEVVAQDPRFFAALTLPGGVREGHFRRTVNEVARDFNKIAKADLFEVLDRQGQIIASVGSGTTTRQSRGAFVESIRGGRATTEIIVGEDAELYQVVVNPVSVEKKIIGFLVLGVRVGDEFARSLKFQTRSEVSFIAGERVAGSTFPSGADRTALVPALTKALVPRGGAGTPHPSIVEIQGASETFLTLARPLHGAAEGSRVLCVMQRSIDDKTAFETIFLARVQGGLGNLGALIVIVAMAFGLVLSHRVTRPILALVRGAEEMEKGNYEYPLDIRTQDEIGYLADRFREMRERQRNYVNSLKESARLKSEFLTVATHELRTPFSIIKAYNELLSSGDMGQIKDEHKKILEVIEEQVDGIERIIEDASWIAQIEGERPILSIAECEVREIVEGAIRAAIADAEDRKHLWLIDIAPDTGTASLDGSRLGQAIAHLVRNGIRFTPDGGRICVRAYRNAGDLVIEVEDSGIGIAEDKTQHLFDRSFMLRDSLNHHSSRTLEFNSAGLGLGLPLARGIVEAHGGAIQVESYAGRGSTFTITIPSAARAAASLAAA